MPTSIDRLGSVQLPERKVCVFNPPVRVAADTVPFETGVVDAASVKAFPVAPRVSCRTVSAVGVPVEVASATPTITLAFSATASAVMVAARVAPMLTCAPVAPDATKVKAVPLIVTVLLTTAPETQQTCARKATFG